MMLHRSRQRKRNGRTLVVVRSGKSTAVAFVNIDRPAFDAQYSAMSSKTTTDSPAIPTRDDRLLPRHARG
jgi:hypothetical protein